MADKSKEEKKPRFGSWYDLAFQTAATLAVSVLAGFFGGRWLDQQFGIFPLLTVIFAVWGAAGGTAWVVLKIKQYSDFLEKSGNDQDQ